MNSIHVHAWQVAARAHGCDATNHRGTVGIRYRKPPTAGRPKIGEVMIVAAMRFVQWMDSRRTPATVKDVCAHFGVHRATANRWLRGYDRAKGLDHAQ
jgi:hypothetical protein